MHPNPSHRIAIAVNNMAISFIEHGKYKHGLRALKQSISIMRNASNYRGSEIISSCGKHQTILVELAKSLANVKASCARMSGDDVRKSGFAVPVEYYHSEGLQSAEPILSRNLCRNNTENVSFVIRISDFDPGWQAMDIDSSILLNNYSVAHFCLARRCASSKTSQQLILKAVKLARLASDSISVSEDVAVDDNSLQKLMQSKPGLFLASVSVLDNLWRISVVLREDLHAEEFSKQLFYCGEAYQAMCSDSGARHAPSA